jgi:hypothetical protein
MQYFNLSLHRSATKSVGQVFREQSYQCLDWVGWEFERQYNHLFTQHNQSELLSVLSMRFADCNYFGDLPIPLLYDDLLTQHPQANYFIVLRDVHEWAVSSFEHCLYVGMHAANPIDDIFSPANRMMLEKYDVLDEIRALLADKDNRGPLLKLWSLLYHRHLISVVDACAQQSVPLKMFYLADPLIGAKLLRYARPGLSEAAYSAYKLYHRHSNDRGRDKDPVHVITSK